MLFPWDHKKKKDLCILFGGVSTEHKVSIDSAKNIFRSVNKEKYNITLVGITKKGRWYLQSPKIFTQKEIDEVEESNEEVFLLPSLEGRLVYVSNLSKRIDIDVIFPVLHGNMGEDGSLQGLFKLVDIPYVGSSILGSCLGLDKDLSKRLFRENNIPTPNFMVFRDHEKIDTNSIVYKLGLPVVVKPSSMGSSIGVSIARKQAEILTSFKNAFKYDRKVIVEEYIEGRELECSVLGNERPRVSPVGEVIPNNEFYSYSAKYSSDSKTEIIIPAKLESKKEKEIRMLAKKAFNTLCCEGMARVDFFLKSDDTVLVNEVNTTPGFTDISMYPKLWEEGGIKYSDLIDRLIELAIERYEREYILKRTI